MDYDDFVLQLTAGPAGGYVARVIASPAGQAECPFSIPFEPEELSPLVAEITRSVAAAPGGSRPDGPGVGFEPPLRLLGERLFASLFSGPLGSRLDQSLGQLRGEEDRGLRLRLQASLAEPALAKLQALPWEYLFRAESGSFLGLSSQIAIVRAPSLPTGGRRPPATLPLRLLVLLCAPRGSRPLNLQDEGDAMERTWAGSALGRVRLLHQPTLDDLRAALRDERPHVLHVMGHGGFDGETGRGAIFFAGRGGKPTPIDGGLLADQLRDCPSLRLVFLNACETACSAAPNPFAGMANALLQAGVPAVLAMQFPIRDGAAVRFSAEVYRQLARGEPVEAAVAEGRLAIRRLHPASLEWGTPVLFLRANDGRLFAHQALQAPVTTGRRPRWVGLAAGLSALVAGGLALHGSLSGGAPTTVPAPVAASPSGIAASLPLAAAPAPAQKAGRPASSASAAQGAAEKEPHPRPAPPRRAADAERREASAPPPVRTHKVASGSPVDLPEVQAELSVQFLDAFGEREFRLFLAPAGGSMSGSAPLLGRDTVAFDTERGRVAVDVLDVDWEHQTVTVRPRQAG